MMEVRETNFYHRKVIHKGVYKMILSENVGLRGIHGRFGLRSAQV